MKKLSNAKKGIIIACAVFVVALAVWLFLLSKLPQTARFETDKGYVTDIITMDSGEWLYATSTGVVVRVGTDNQPAAEYDLAALVGQKHGFDQGTLRGLYKNQDSDYIWGVISTRGTENQRYLFKSVLTENGLEILAEVPFNANVDNSFYLESGDRFYVLSTGQQLAELQSFQADDLSAVDRTVLYDCNQAGSKVKLSAIQMSKGCNLFTSNGEHLFIVYDGGVIRLARDFADVRYESTSRSYTVDALDTASYLSFQLSGIDSKGAAYVAEKDTFYIIDRSDRVHTFTGSMIDTLKVGKTLTCSEVAGITVPDIPKESAALSFDPQTNSGYIMYEKTANVTRVDFNAEAIDFTFALNFNIDKIVYGNQPGDIYYLYKNVNETGQAEHTILCHTNIELRRSEGAINTAMTVAAVVGVLAAVICLVLLVIVLRKREEDAQKTLKKMARRKWVYIALIPSVVLLCMFCYYEAIASIGLSFFDYTLENPTVIWNNFNNYKEVFTSSHAAEAFGNMVLFLVFDLIVAVIPPVLFAFFLTILRWEKMSNFIRTMLFISGIVPSVAGMLIWRVGIYGGDGVLNTIIEALGGDPIAFLGQTEYAKWSVLFIGFPFVGAYLIFYGGMMNIPKSYYEAAELEGIGIWRRFFTIDLPLISPQLKYVVITSFIASMQNFSRTYMITGGNYGTYTPVHLMYQEMLSGNYGLASAYATIIFLLLFVATFINMRSQRKELED